MSRSLILASALAAAVLPGAATANRYDDANVVTDVVSVADLDLSTGYGMDRLIHRLRGRIDAMCDWDEACRDEAWLSADWQVARAVSRDQWRRRIAMERMADRRRYRMMRVRRVSPPPPPPRVAKAPPPPALVSSKVVKTTTVTTTTTTTIILTYRLPPPDARVIWR